MDESNRVIGVMSARDARLLILRPTRLRFLKQPLELFEELHVEPFDAKVHLLPMLSVLYDLI